MGEDIELRGIFEDADGHVEPYRYTALVLKTEDLHYLAKVLVAK